MTHRLDIRKAARLVTIEFHGLLDAVALEDLQQAVARAAPGGPVRVVLREGTEIERGCVADLRALEAELVAESAYLARWIGAAAGR